MVDVPKNLVAKVVFDQSIYVKTAIRNLGNEGGIGLALTALMILIFLGISGRQSRCCCLSRFLPWPLSWLLTQAAAQSTRWYSAALLWCFRVSSITQLSCWKTSFRHLEEGETPEVAAERGGQEVELPVLAATFTTAIVFFPVLFLYGVSRFLFTALAAGVVIRSLRLIWLP